MKEIIEKLNNLKITQESIEFLEDLPEDIYEKYFESTTIVENVLDVEKHRWYETSISVYKLPEGFLGVRSITDVVGENNSVEDMFHRLKFFEMEPIQTTTYIIKK